MEVVGIGCPRWTTMWQVEMDGQVLEEEETACTRYDDMRVWKVHKDL